MSDQDWLTDEGKKSLPANSPLAQRPWRSTPIMIDDAKRVCLYESSELCFLEQYSQAQINQLIDQSQNDGHLFFIQCDEKLPSDLIMPRFFSLYPIEVEKTQRDTNNNNSCTAIILNNRKASVLIDFSKIMIRKDRADRLLGLHHLSQEKKLKKSAFRDDAISDAILNHIFPEVLPNRNIPLDKKLRWRCFLLLETALTKCGTTKIKLNKRDHSKEKSDVKGTDKHGADFYTTYKNFKDRLRNLLIVYQNKP